MLVAPPGSGKTTLVAPWLVDSGLAAGGEVVVLQPRRAAARSVARFMAAARGERVGGWVGFQVRFESRVSAQTRIRVVTEGILTSRLQRDPELAGVAAVVLDEFHERSVHADLALALLKEVQEVLRPELKVVVMSATLDASRVAGYLGGCGVVRAEGRSFEVETTFAEAGDAIEPWASGRDVEARMARAVLACVDGEPGADVLGFLPGVRLIEGTRQRLSRPLAERGYDVEVLHGRLASQEQDRVLAPGRRPRVVLATNIAETSLTIPGIRAVVDSGLAKVMRYDLAVGSGRLETQRISRASADQRRGRAGRLGPGRCLRLWTHHEDERLTAFETPEIQRIDLARVMLELARWGTDAMSFDYFEAPDARRLTDARQRLQRLGALDEEGRITELGRRVARVPADPRLGAFLCAAADRAPEELSEAALWAAVIDQGEARGGLRESVERVRDKPRVVRAARQLEVRAAEGAGESATITDCLLAGYADRVAIHREGDRYALVGGRMGIAAEAQRAEAIIALELDAGRRGEGALSTIAAHVPIERQSLQAHPAYETVEELVWDPAQRRVQAYVSDRFFDLTLSRRPTPNRDRTGSTALLVERASAALDMVFGGLGSDAETALARWMTLARLHPELELPATRQDWLRAALPAMAEGLSSFAELIKRPAISLPRALAAHAGWAAERILRDELPERLEVPSGSRIKVVYHADRPPALAVKVQEVFGLEATPRLGGGRLPVRMELLSPAGRPLQVTSDLASFWSSTWPSVRAEMRTRYPKHHWPEDPATALPSARTTVRRLKPGRD